MKFYFAQLEKESLIHKDKIDHKALVKAIKNTNYENHIPITHSITGHYLR